MSDDVGSTTAGSGADPAEQGGVWREIGANEVLPPGCHVRMNVTTGRSEALAPREAAEAPSLDWGEGHTPAQGTVNTKDSDANERESGSAETVQTVESAPLNDALKAPAAKPSHQRGKKRLPQAAKTGSVKKGNGVTAAGVDAQEREHTIARLATLPDDAEYEVRVKLEAKRIGVRVALIDKRRAAYKKANSSGVVPAALHLAVARLKDKPRVDYLLQRKKEAAQLGIPVTQLDQLVKGVREQTKTAANGGAGFAITSKKPPGVGPKPPREADADGVIFPDGFVMKETGLWLLPDADGEPEWICSPFRIAAGTNDDADQSFGLLLRWTDCNHRKHEWAMPKRMVHADGNPIAIELEDAGLSCGASRKAHDGLKRFLGAVRSIHRVRCVERAGWHGHTYVFPNGRVFGAEGSDCLVLQSEHAATAGAYAELGTRAEWQDQIARLAVGNDRMVLTLSAAFAGSLLDVMGEVSGGVHLHGGSQTGKTTLMCAAASVYGPGDNKTGPIRSWRSTANGMEAVAAEHSDGLLILDEIGQANGREVGEVVYMLSNQRGKARMARAGGARRIMTWRLIYLSTGETRLATKMNEAKQRLYAGQEVRLLNIPADAGAGLGVFQNLQGAASAGTFADQLRRAAVSCYGTAGPAFLEALALDRANDPEKLENALRLGREKFLAANVPEAADGQVRSAAARFGLIGLAGELARNYGVVPWPEGEAFRAAKACFQAWLTARGGAGAAEDAQAIKRAKEFFARHGASRFERLVDDPDATPQDQSIRGPRRLRSTRRRRARVPGLPVDLARRDLRRHGRRPGDTSVVGRHVRGAGEGRTSLLTERAHPRTGPRPVLRGARRDPE